LRFRVVRRLFTIIGGVCHVVVCISISIGVGWTETSWSDT
jgi:hypothetical protein